MRPNTVKGTELWVRCLFCGDSVKHSNSAHMSINLETGLYHCFLCSAGGRVTPQVLFNLQVRDYPALDFNTRRTMPMVIAGPGSSRKSLLDRYHTSQGDDVFYSWWRDAHVGYYVRGEQKRLWGFSGINWHQAPRPLISSPEAPLRFVEGPYDVQTARDVCFFGIPSLSKIYQFFREHYFVLVPDGDLWTDQSRFAILKALIHTLIKDNYGFLGIEFLAKAADPDEAKGRFIPVDYFKEKLWQSTSLSSKAQLALAKVR